VTADIVKIKTMQTVKEIRACS